MLSRLDALKMVDAQLAKCTRSKGHNSVCFIDVEQLLSMHTRIKPYTQKNGLDMPNTRFSQHFRFRKSEKS